MRQRLLLIVLGVLLGLVLRAILPPADHAGPRPHRGAEEREATDAPPGAALGCATPASRQTPAAAA